MSLGFRALGVLRREVVGKFCGFLFLETVMRDMYRGYIGVIRDKQGLGFAEVRGAFKGAMSDIYIYIHTYT